MSPRTKGKKHQSPETNRVERVVVKTSPSKTTRGKNTSPSSSTNQTHIETITTSIINGKRTVVKETKKTRHTQGSQDAAVKIVKHTTVRHAGQPNDSLNTRIQSTTKLALGSIDDDTLKSRTESLVESDKNVELESPSKDNVNDDKHEDTADLSSARLQQTVTQRTSVVSGQEEIVSSAKQTLKSDDQQQSKKKTKRSKASKKSSPGNQEQTDQDSEVKPDTTQEISVAGTDTRTKQGLSSRSVQQTVTQHVSVSQGRQEFSTGSRSSQRTVVQRQSRQTVSSEGSNLNASGQLEQTVVRSVIEPDTKEEIILTEKEIRSKQDGVSDKRKSAKKSAPEQPDHDREVKSDTTQEITAADTDTSTEQGLSSRKVQQTVTQHVSVSQGKQEFSTSSRSSQRTVVQRQSRQTVGSEESNLSAPGHLEQTVVQSIIEPVATEEIISTDKEICSKQDDVSNKRKSTKKSALEQTDHDREVKRDTTQEISATDADTRTGQGLSSTSIQQTVTQHVSVSHGKQEFSTGARSSQRTVVEKHSTQTVSSEGSDLNASEQLEQTVVQSTTEPGAKEEIISTDKEICSKQDGENNNLTTTGDQQSVTQQISVSAGKQETSASAERSERALIQQHSKVISRSKGSRHSATETSEKSVEHKSDSQLQTITSSAKGAQGMVVKTEKTDHKHGTKSSSSSEKTVVQRVNKGNRKQEITITSSSTSSEQHFVQVSTVKTVKKSKATKKR